MNNGPDVSITEETIERIVAELGASREDIAEASASTLLRMLQKLEYPDRARDRVRHELGARQGDAGEMPGEGFARAQAQLDTMRAQKLEGESIAGLPTGPTVRPGDVRILDATAGLNADNTGWTALGPGNIGGRTRAIVIDHTNPARIFAAGAGGGVWRSLDAGASWTPTNDLMANLAVCSLVMDPADAEVLFAGTGEGFSNMDAIRGDGIFRSTDGGATWTGIIATSANPDFFYVNSLAISADGSRMLAGTTRGIFLSTDAAHDLWVRVASTPIGNVAFDPEDDQQAIAGGLAGGQALFSTDGGATWNAAVVPPGGDRVQVCYAAADPSTCYASVEASPSRIWRSTDGGRRYHARTALAEGADANFLGSQGWYDNVIWAGDPTDAALVIVGGIDLWKSADGGNTLGRISRWQASPRSAHADHHAIVADPGYDGAGNRRVYFGNDGGIYRTDDVTTVGNDSERSNGWVNLNNGYAVTQFYFGTGDITTNTVVGGTQDNGTLRHTAATGTVWNEWFGGDGGSVGSDRTNPQVYYGEYVRLEIFRNTNGAVSDANWWETYISGRVWDNGWRTKPVPFQIPDAGTSRALFIAPFVLDPNNSDRILAGGASLWRTDDAKTPNTVATGPSWMSVKPPAGASSISAIAIALGNSDQVLVGHTNGDVYRSTNATDPNPSWDRIDANGIGANRWCLALAIDPDDNDVVYAGFAGYSADNLWKSEDGGATWSDISGTLPWAPIRAITMHPQRSSWLYLATEVGVFASEDAGHTWSPTNEGPANVACRDLFWMRSELVVATHGRGMFTTDLKIAHAFPNPELEITGTEPYSTSDGNFTRYRMAVTNRDAYPNSLFFASPDLPPCGQNMAAARTWVDVYDATTNQRINGFCALEGPDDLVRVWFSVAAGAAPPARVYVVLRDRLCSSNYVSNTVATDGVVADGGVERRAVTAVDKNTRGKLTHLCGPWGRVRVSEAVSQIEAGTHEYFTDVAGEQAAISVVRGRYGRHLRSSGDARRGNNLRSLPRCP